MDSKKLNTITFTWISEGKDIYLDIWNNGYSTLISEGKELPGYLKERFYTWISEGEDKLSGYLEEKINYLNI